MTLFIRIFCLFLVLSTVCFAQTTIKAGNGTISVANHEWGQGIFRYYVEPTAMETKAGRVVLPNAARTLHGYFYRADFTNENGLKVKGIFWEFIFLDPNTKKEINRHKIYSKVSIDTNETDTVDFFSRKPPSRVVSAEVLGEEDMKKQYLSHVEIKAVMLSDGTIWKGSNTSDDDCNKLIREVKNGRIF